MEAYLRINSSDFSTFLMHLDPISAISTITCFLDNWRLLSYLGIADDFAQMRDHTMISYDQRKKQILRKLEDEDQWNLND